MTQSLLHLIMMHPLAVVFPVKVAPLFQSRLNDILVYFRASVAENKVFFKTLSRGIQDLKNLSMLRI